MLFLAEIFDAPVSASYAVVGETGTILSAGILLDTISGQPGTPLPRTANDLRQRHLDH